MAERWLLRMSAVSLVAGAVLGIIVNALYPRVADPNDLEALLRRVAESTVWRGVQLGIVFTVLLVLGGLAGLYRSITVQPGAALARLGFAIAAVGTALGVVLFAVNGFALKSMADAWAIAPAAERAVALHSADAVGQVGLGLFSIWIVVFFGVTFILYGLAVALGSGYPRWLGWAAVAAGVGAALVGLVQYYNGPSAMVTNVLFPVFSVILTVWLLVMGALMWLKASTAA
ncbi:MAG: DUF4386 family protein [Chloroflexi bacterium]|nr:DUF4386 family protein [Chloroflexota bacterium]